MIHHFLFLLIRLYFVSIWGCDGPRRRSALAVTDLAEAWSRGSTPCPRPGAAAGRSYPTPEVRGGGPEVRWLHWRRRAQRSYSMFKVRRGGGEEIPLVHGKEQQLRFAGVAMKRYPTSKVREMQVRP